MDFKKLMERYQNVIVGFVLGFLIPILVFIIISFFNPNKLIGNFFEIFIGQLLPFFPIRFYLSLVPAIIFSMLLFYLKKFDKNTTKYKIIFWCSIALYILFILTYLFMFTARYAPTFTK